MEGEKKCCKCVHYRWLAPPRVVWTDPADGKAYCVFHAPAGNLSIQNEDFTKLIIDRIREAYFSNDGSTCSLSGITVPGMFQLQELDHQIPHQVDFSNSTFQGGANFSKLVLQEINFSNAVFQGNFHATHSRIISSSFRNCTFEKSFKCISSEFVDVDFSDARFLGFANFARSTFGRSNDKTFSIGKGTTFFNVGFSNSADFSVINSHSPITFSRIEARDKSIYLHSISDESFSNIVFSSTDIEKFSIKSCRWPIRLGLEVHGDGNFNSLIEYEELYRAMKQRAAEEHDQPQVSRWHFREKLMRLKLLLFSANCNARIEAVEDSELCKGTRARAWWELFRALPWGLRISLPFLYWTFSGFGERRIRAGICLLALALVPIFVLLPLKLAETGLRLTPNTQKIAELLLEWLRCMPFAKLDAPTPNPPTIISALRTILSYGFQLVIGLQAALFALAVRNRFRR